MANATTSRLLAWEAGARLRTLQMTWLRDAECSDLSQLLPDVATIADEVGFAVDTGKWNRCIKVVRTAAAA
jgi:hypothetical protein